MAAFSFTGLLRRFMPGGQTSSGERREVVTARLNSVGVDIDKIEELNPALADFCQTSLAPALGDEVGGIVDDAAERQAKTRRLLDGNAGELVLRLSTSRQEETTTWTATVTLLKETPAGLSGLAVRRLEFRLGGDGFPAMRDGSLPASAMGLLLEASTPVVVRVHDVFGRVYELRADVDAAVDETLVLLPGPLSGLRAPLRAPTRAAGHESETLGSMGASEALMHGWRGVGLGWSPPVLTAYCDQEARPGYASVKAHEFHDEPATLVAKVQLLARLLCDAEHAVVYSGAGISTASGIGDYATRTVQSTVRPKRRGLDSEPTYAHYVLAALQRRGLLAHWVNQNHDCLGEKAGFPVQLVNEIHGSWFDPSNPVVPMQGTLRSDLYAALKREERAADLVLAVGTSLCGMNADRMVTTCGARAVDEGRGVGSVIIGFQQTRLDEYACLRIFANIDQVMLLLGVELGLDVRLVNYSPDVPPAARLPDRPHVFRVPYDRHSGERSATRHCLWDLSVGARLMLTAGPGRGFFGEVLRTPSDEHDYYLIVMPNTREGPELGKGFGHYALGTWWIEAAAKGLADALPCVNLTKAQRAVYVSCAQR